MASSRQLAQRIARICEAKKATEIAILDMRKDTFITDFFVVCSTQSERQSQAVSDQLFYDLKKDGVGRLGVEGYTPGQWVLNDFGSVVCHVFLEEVRRFYDLEALWQDVPRLAFKTKPPRRR